MVGPRMLNEKNGDKSALIFDGDAISFDALRQLVELEKRSHARLDRELVILTASHAPRFVIQLLSLLESGIAVAVFSPLWSAEETRQRRTLVGKSVQLDDAGDIVWRSSTQAVRHHPATALVLFTSGSSGQAKAVQLSRAGIAANTDAVLATIAFDPDGEQALVLPLSYAFGLLGQLLPALACGCTTRLLPGLMDLKFLLEGGWRGMVSGVPSHHEMLLRVFAGSAGRYNVTAIVSAGAMLATDLRQRLHAGFPSATLYTNYGQTEFSPRILALDSTQAQFFQGADGFAVPGVKLKLLADGELCVQGPQLMLGYLGDADASAAKIRQGWLHTGDLARLEAGGLVFIEGRLDDLFKVAGERISPHEIEAALKTLPQVRDAAIVALPDGLYGATIAAFLEAPEPFHLARHELADRLQTLLSPRKIPGAYYHVSCLPRNEHGKLQRAGLAGLLAHARRIL